MSLLSRLFGGGSASQSDKTAETYQGMRIYPTPQREAGGFRLSARIEQDQDGQTRIHELVRADMFQSEDDAKAAAIAKAKQIIDEQGKALFD